MIYFKYAIDKGLMRLEIDLAHLIKSNANKTQVKNAMSMSRVTSMQTCESIRAELGLTLQNCDKALTKLNDYVASLKALKIYKDATLELGIKSPKTNRKTGNFKILIVNLWLEDLFY